MDLLSAGDNAVRALSATAWLEEIIGASGGADASQSYARESTPEAVWHTTQFHAVNRRISAVWGLAFLFGTISLIVAGSVDVRQVLLRVVVPFGLLALAYTYTQNQRGEHVKAS